jgi:hypothetical protein
MLQSGHCLNEDTFVVRRDAFKPKEAVLGRHNIARAKILVVEPTRQHLSGSLLLRLLFLLHELALTPNLLNPLTSSINLGLPFLFCVLVDILLGKGLRIWPQQRANGNGEEHSRAWFHRAVHLFYLHSTDLNATIAEAIRHLVGGNDQTRVELLLPRSRIFC